MKEKEEEDKVEENPQPEAPPVINLTNLQEILHTYKSGGNLSKPLRRRKNNYLRNHSNRR